MRPLANTIHLVALDADGIPLTGKEAGLGSGCLIRCDGALALIGTRHVTDRIKRWGMQIEYSPESGMCSFILGAPTNICRMSFASGEIDDLDFFVLPIELGKEPMHQEWAGFNILEHEEPKRIFEFSDISVASKDQEYCFGGLVLPTVFQAIHPHTVLELHPTVQEKLKFAEEEKNRLRFKLPVKHPGHKFYQGCSGAPIVDKEGALVGLVASGCEENGSIFAVPLAQYAGAIFATIDAERAEAVADQRTARRE